MIRLENRKAKVGDQIKSFEYKDESGCRSDYYVGVVTDVKQGDNDTCEMVYFTAFERVHVNRYSGDIERTVRVNELVKVPQNGVYTSFGEKMENIKIIIGVS